MTDNQKTTMITTKTILGRTIQVKEAPDLDNDEPESDSSEAFKVVGAEMANDLFPDKALEESMRYLLRSVRYQVKEAPDLDNDEPESDSSEADKVVGAEMANDLFPDKALEESMRYLLRSVRYKGK